MRWKVCAFLVSIFAVVGMSIAFLGDAPSRGASRDSYRRPAEIPYPDDNPYSAAKAALGRMLFFDPVLSGSHVRSCGTCHNPSLSWGDGAPRAIGEGNAPLALRSPTLLAIAWIPRLGWDGKFHDLESVTFGPITSPANMNLSEAALMGRLQAIPGYVSAFEAAFANRYHTTQRRACVATFRRSWRSRHPSTNGSGDEARRRSRQRGFDLLTARRCSNCHNGFAFSDGSFHDIGTATGVMLDAVFPDLRQVRYAFKTPTLRDVARRAPTCTTARPHLGSRYRSMIAAASTAQPFGIAAGADAGRKADLVVFIDTLTGPSQAVCSQSSPADTTAAPLTQAPSGGKLPRSATGQGSTAATSEQCEAGNPSRCPRHAPAQPYERIGLRRVGRLQGPDLRTENADHRL